MNEPERLERCTTMVGGHMGGQCGRHRGHDPELECRLATSMETRLWKALADAVAEAAFYEKQARELREQK